MNFLNYIDFSDSAKYAVIARNIVNGIGFKTDFVFFNQELIGLGLPVEAYWIPPVPAIIMSFFFKIFGTSDLSVMAFSLFFFLFSVVLLFILANKLFGRTVALMVSSAFLFSASLLEYAKSGGVETLLIFEIILALYLFSVKKKWTDIFGFFVLLIMYFTKAQAVIYIFGSVLFFLLSNYKFQKALGFFFLIFFFGSVLILTIQSQGLFAVTQHIPGVATSDSLRGAMQEASLAVLLKKVFYNLYNFYKLMPQIMNPYLWGLFVIGLFRWYKDKTLNALKISTIFMVVMTFFITAATIPFFRYIHPVVPLVYLFAVETLVWIVTQIFNSKFSILNQILISNFKLTKQKFVIMASSFLILFLAVGQTLGVIFLDSRFERKTKNVGKPPVYTRLSWLLRDNTKKEDVIVTNLDTWGSWYGERKTVWFPLEPKQLIDPETGEIPFDAIYLTSYLIDDENYYMGESWRQIFFNPSSPEKWSCDGCAKLAADFTLKDSYKISASDNYQKEDASAVLLVKRIKGVQ